MPSRAAAAVARAADTTHKVLLYHFDGADDLLGQAVARLRDRRIARGLAAAEGAAPQTLAVRVRTAWPILAGEESWVHDQAIGLMMYEPARYGKFGPGIHALVPAGFAVHLPAELVRAAQARGRRDDPGGPAGVS